MKFNFKENKNLWVIVAIVLLLVIVTGTTYAFFNYTRTGPANTIRLGTISFDFNDSPAITLGNAFPIDESSIDEKIEKDFTITAHTSLPEGISYRIYAVYGDEDTNKNRLLDSVMKLKFTPPTNGDGFTTLSNNYNTATNLTFNEGKALIATGLVQNTQDLTTKTFHMELWIDSDKIFISSTTKRLTNAEGYPSLADTADGTVLADRYIKNDSNLESTTLYPARSNQEGKIIYTTNEFANSYYSIKIAVEATDVAS